MSGMSTEAYTQWWNTLDDASKAYYTQCVSFSRLPLRVLPHKWLNLTRFLRT